MSDCEKWRPWLSAGLERNEEERNLRSHTTANMVVVRVIKDDGYSKMMRGVLKPGAEERSRST